MICIGEIQMNKIGVADYGMDVWFGGNYNLEQRLRKLKAIGIDGIEWLQASNDNEAMNKATIFHKLGMDFCSCNAGANFEQAVRNACAFGKEYVWLPVPPSRALPMEDYIRRSNDAVEAAAEYGIKVALHNHLGCRIQNPEELDEFMEKVPGAWLLLDIGHLFAAGGDLVKAVENYHDRFAAVHFKDVFYKDKSISIEEAWGQRLRFCELEGGNAGMDVKSFCEALKKVNYKKWLLIEHDTHLRDPYLDLAHTADVLRKYLGD